MLANKQFSRTEAKEGLQLFEVGKLFTVTAFHKNEEKFRCRSGIPPIVEDQGLLDLVMLRRTSLERLPSRVTACHAPVKTEASTGQ